MTKQLTRINNYEEILTNDIPILDVRAAVEFDKGAFPCATNIPILNDEERKLVGTCYTKQNQDAAVKLGHEIVSGENKETKLKAWHKFVTENPHGALYCFRGGKRSGYTQQWIYDNFGINYPLIDGGYKAMRNFLIETLETADQWLTPIIIGGRTGSGKTKFLKKFNNHIDLENLANHKGSAFGRPIFEQPTQINFENNLATNLLKLKKQGCTKILFEDEAENIGRVCSPKPFYATLKNGDLYIIEASYEERIQSIFEEYIQEASANYQEVFGKEAGFKKWSELLLASLFSIRKRLGDERYRELKAVMEKGFSDEENHKHWIKILLKDYYDPMYDYYTDQYKDRVVMRGSAGDIAEKIKSSTTL